MLISKLGVIVGVGIVFGMTSFVYAQEGEIIEKIPEPEEIVFTPRVPVKKPIVLDNGSIVVESVESYDIAEKDMSACSFIARNNIALLLESMSIVSDDIPRGDAYDLIQTGRLYDMLTSFADKDTLLESLTERNTLHVETVFDVYRYVQRRPVGLQGHRVAVFRGDDGQWYILDPVDGKKTRKPQLFSEFLKNDTDDAEWFVRFPGYSMMNLVTESEFAQALPYFSSELRAFFQTYNRNTPLLVYSDSSSLPPL